ncbi:glycosyltransferase [Anaerobacillus alkaliphilus]|uniref:Glycosyltransferase n=1 Tax=Anaerobacillus alkaliphilus TaxID=1548597 RepID=A0A4Q0VQW6_9BACI|nr:glycosyltransferase [Anaerobacillus alkaliphilus]RXI98375.1 glycosyltransferase [Anaerobacillus alkaliphilus]
MEGPKVLILTSNYGNGHLQVADSLVQEFKRSGGNQVIVKDLFYETSPTFNEWTKKIYLKSFTKSGRHIYRLFYYSSKQITKRKNLKLLSYGYSKLCKIVDQEKPDVIINTFPSFAVPFHRSKTKAIIPTYNVITDYCLHHSWIHPNIDKYYVASRKLKQDLLELGISQTKIFVSGMPINPVFEETTFRGDLVQKYQVNPTKKTVLIVAGAYGVSNEMKEICDRLKDDPVIQLLIVCGKNVELYNQLKTKYQTYTDIKVFGYVTEMAELLKISTCVITKPGGIILSEAMAMNTPIVLPKATPGQERENAQFFQEQGAAVWHEDKDKLVTEIKHLIRNEMKLIEMKENLSMLHFPNSSRAIINDILRQYDCSKTNEKYLKL